MDRAYDVLGSLLEHDPPDHRGLSRAVRAYAARLGDDQRSRLEGLLWADVFSEYDARFLSAYVRTLPGPRTPHFWACEARWARDEELHCQGFRTVYAALTGASAEALEARLAARTACVDFGPLADLFADEFVAACLLAYDELATVRAYRSSLGAYALLGPQVLAFVRRVIADEGRHFRNFLKLLREEHEGRLGEVDAVIARIRAREGQAYGNTFVLDHDDDVWSDRIFDESAEVLRRKLRRPVASAC